MILISRLQTPAEYFTNRNNIFLVPISSQEAGLGGHFVCNLEIDYTGLGISKAERSSLAKGWDNKIWLEVRTSKKNQLSTAPSA